MTPAIFIGLAGMLLLGAGAMLLLRGSGSDKLRARIQAVKPVVASAPVLTLNIRIDAPDDKPWHVRLFRILGYNPNIPRSHALPLPAVLGICAAVGIAIEWRLQPVVGASTAIPIGLGVAMVLVVAIWRRQTNRYREALFKQLPEVLGQLVRAVRAGLPVIEALRRTAPSMAMPSQGEFTTVMGETTIGVPLETALRNLHERVGLTEYSFLAITISLQAQTGGYLTESLDNLAEMTRRRVSAAAKAKALAAEARASAMILGALPFVVALALLFLNPNYIMMLFDTALGNKMVVAFVSLLTMGMLTIRWMIQRSTQD